MPAEMLAAQGMGALLPLQAAAGGGGAAHAAAEFAEIEAAAAAAAAAAAPAVVPAGFIRAVHYNMVPMNTHGVVVSRLSLEGLHSPLTLQQRLMQQLSMSPALQLTSLELSFVQNSETAQGSGVFWQQLLKQMPLLRELRLGGLGACETGFEVPHLWHCVNQLTGACSFMFEKRAV
jgi:hypothetical protein